MLFLEGFFENIEVFSMEHQNSVVFVNDQDLTFFYVLAKCYSFAEFKRITLDQLASGVSLSLVVTLYLSKSHKMQSIIERIAKN